MQHYFLKQSAQLGASVDLNSDISRHWVKVMRATPGDHAEFVDLNGNLFLGQLQTSTDEKTTVKLVENLDSKSEIPVNVTLIMGLPKQDKADWIVQKTTEMGVSEVIFFAADWSVAQWKGNRIDKKLERLQKIAAGAAEQSHRLKIPTIKYEKSLENIVTSFSGRLLVAYEEAAKQGEKSELRHQLGEVNSGDNLAVVVGPEGGISPAEIQLLENNNGIKVGLGPRILRTETAPLYFLAAVSTIIELNS